MRRLVEKVVGASVAVLLLWNVAVAEETGSANNGDEGEPAIVWVGTVATNVIYVPAKVVYALCGGITGALAWALTGGDAEVANSVWRPTI